MGFLVNCIVCKVTFTLKESFVFNGIARGPVYFFYIKNNFLIVCSQK